MDKLNELGFVNFWGITPCINILYGEESLLKARFTNKLKSKTETDNDISKDTNKEKEILNKNSNSNGTSNANADDTNIRYKDKINLLNKFANLGLIKQPELSKAPEQNSEEGLNFLLSNTSDMRHVLKTLSFLVEYCNKNYYEILGINTTNTNSKINLPFPKLDLNFYIYEYFSENIVRFILLVDLITNKNYTNIEKIDMFLEIYGNTLLAEKSDAFINSRINKLNDLIYKKKPNKQREESDNDIDLNDLFSFENLHFREVDDLKEIIDSYSEKVDFNIEKLREERMRFLFKDRFDYKENMVDWDYQMKMKKFLDYMGYVIYKRFRIDGISFIRQNVKYNKPNKTLSSYIPGRSVR